MLRFYKEINNLNNSIKALSGIIYRQISKRVMKRKKKLSLTNEQISGNNLQLVSNVIHNHRKSTRNPYLLTPQLIEDIMKSLKFTSTYELIWGSDSELDLLISACALYGLRFLLSNSEDKVLVEKCCYEYLPYAEDMAIISTLDSPVREGAYKDVEIMALSYIRYSLFDELKIAHKKFFYDKGTSKIDKQLVLFFENELTRLLHEFLSKRDLYGWKSYQLIRSVLKYEDIVHIENFPPDYNDYAYKTDPIIGDKIRLPITVNKKPTKLMEIHSNLAEAGSDFIYEMVELQMQTDPFFKDKPWIKASVI